MYAELPWTILDRYAANPFHEDAEDLSFKSMLRSCCVSDLTTGMQICTLLVV